MNFAEHLRSRSNLQNIATILRVSRKQRAFSTAENALFLGFPKSVYENWEAALDMPNFHEWAQICDRYELDLDVCRGGFLDSGKAIEIRQSSKVGGFTLPDRYASWQATSNRWLIPIVEYLRFQKGEEGFRTFCEKIEMDPDYFYVGDQLVNFRFTQDVLLELTQILREKKITNAIESIANAAFFSIGSSHSNGLFEKNRSHESILFGLIQFNKYLDLAFGYELVESLDDGYYICTSAADWIKPELQLEDHVKSWYHRYKMEWFKNLLFATSRTKTKIDVIELDDQKDPDCLFRVQIA